MSKTISNQNDWDDLLAMILGKQQLTPILGKEMYKFKDGDNLVLLDGWLSKQLLASNNVTDQPEMTLTQAVNYLVNEKKVASTWALVSPLTNLVKGINFDFPLLTDFLSITDLMYFLNTEVYFNILEDKLKATRKQSANFLNADIQNFIDFPLLSGLNVPLVFNIFSSLDARFQALSDEELLEYTSAFYENIKHTPNIANALNQDLLFIGCSFPDWMVRFVLRLLANQPLREWGANRRKIYFINDDNQFQAKPIEFLKNYDVTTYNGTTNDFVKELLSQWEKKAVKSKLIFLSYSRQDNAAVAAMKMALQSIKGVDCFYDVDDIPPGADFKSEIIIKIKNADLFIPLLSGNSLANKDAYVYKEWSQAETFKVVKDAEKSGVENFLLPVSIDNTDRADPRIPDFFRSLNIEQAPNGQPDDKFINNIKTVLNLI